MSRPKIGLALSGASGRAIAHAGVLDVFEEQGIPVDYIAACSSGAIIAAAYSCGTLRQLKATLFGGFNRMELLGLFEAAETTGGLFSLNKVEERMKSFTHGLRFEEVRPHLAMVCVDIATAEQVVISMGDIAKGIVASCSVPFIFEPARWGNRQLVDGVLLNLVPADVVRDMGADIVISVEIAAAKYILSNTEIRLLQTLVIILQSIGLPYRYAKKFIQFIKSKLKIGDFVQIYSQSDFLPGSGHDESMVSVITKVLEVRFKAFGLKNDYKIYSDIILTPKVKHFGRTEFNTLRRAYVEGRQSAQSAIPQILKLIEQYEVNASAAAKSKNQLLTESLK